MVYNENKTGIHEYLLLKEKQLSYSNERYLVFNVYLYISVLSETNIADN